LWGKPSWVGAWYGFGCGFIFLFCGANLLGLVAYGLWVSSVFLFWVMEPQPSRGFGISIRVAATGLFFLLNLLVGDNI